MRSHHLKRGIALAPDDGNLHYLLGSLHAQAGWHERAIDEMSKAVRLAPQLETARFQLGLLQLTSGGVDAAVATWSALDALDAGHPLRLFKTGLLHLVRDEFAECIDALRRGIAQNERHPALNRDMQRVSARPKPHSRQTRSTRASRLPSVAAPQGALQRTGEAGSAQASAAAGRGADGPRRVYSRSGSSSRESGISAR